MMNYRRKASIIIERGRYVYYANCYRSCVRVFYIFRFIWRLGYERMVPNANGYAAGNDV